MTSRQSWRITFFVFAIVPLSASPGFGQELVVGERVRISTHGEEAGVLVGMIESSEPGSLVIQTEASILTTVAWNDVSRLQVSRGQKSRSWLGAGVGAGVGILASGVVWSLANEEDDSSFFNPYMMAAGAVAGGLLGYVVGSAIKVERWEDVPANRWQIQVAPDLNGGVALGLSLRM